MEALGRLIDISTGIVPADLQTAQTGKRVGMKHSAGCMAVVYKAAGTAGDDPTLTLKQHTAASGGTSANLATIDRYYLKAEAALDGDETWVLKTQTAAATIADPGAAGTSAEEQQIIVFHVEGTELADGYTHISVDIADTGLNAQLGSVLYVLYDLMTPRAPANLVNPQT